MLHESQAFPTFKYMASWQIMPVVDGVLSAKFL
jgi:hypothetical protein